MRHITSAEARKSFSFTLGESDESLLSNLCESYVKAQLEHGIPALDYWKSVK
jgi:hypothetical protein